jgi:hypothetical protein
MNDADELDFDDGATSVITGDAPRLQAARSPETAAQMKPGGKMVNVQPLGVEAQREFISLRTPQGAVRITFSHFPFLKALWRVSLRKRVRGEDEGVRAKEIADEMNISTTKVTAIISSLRSNEVARSVTTHEGWAKVVSKHYPTELGYQLLALASFLGNGVIQVGRNSSAWANRANDEPESFFRHADFIRAKTS